MKYALLLITVATILLSACTQPKAKDMLKNEMQKKDIFSAILNDADLSSELMDSFINTHHQIAMMKMDAMMKHDNMTRNHIMETMMNMADDDSVLAAKMVSMMFEYPHLRSFLQPNFITLKQDNTRVDMSGHIQKITK